jgi:fermentation-respiration switch protein FrsA (DUF1100 family)
MAELLRQWDERRRRRGYWRNLGLYVLGLAGVGVLVVAVWMARAHTMTFIHPARPPLQQTPGGFEISGWESVRFPAADGVVLAGWFVPPDPAGGGATVILQHGSRNNRVEMLPQAAMLHRHGYGALLYDFRAHGESGGEVSTLGYREVADLRGAVDYLLARPEVNPERIAVLGHSMGGAVAIRGAARIPEVRAVVAQGAYTSVEENLESGVRAFMGLPPALFAPLVAWLGERETGLDIRLMRPIDDVGQIAPRPVLFVQGARDTAVPIENGRRLYEAAGEPKELYVVAEAGHGGYLRIAPDEFERRVVGFLDRYLHGE